MARALDGRDLRENSGRNGVAFARDHLIAFQRDRDGLDAIGLSFASGCGSSLIENDVRPNQWRQCRIECRLLIRGPTGQSDDALSSFRRAAESASILMRGAGTIIRATELRTSKTTILFLQTLCITVVVNVFLADFAKERRDAVEICFVEVVFGDGLCDCGPPSPFQMSVLFPAVDCAPRSFQAERKLCTEASARLESKLKTGRAVSLAIFLRLSVSDWSTAVRSVGATIERPSTSPSW